MLLTGEAAKFSPLEVVLHNRETPFDGIVLRRPGDVEYRSPSVRLRFQFVRAGKMKPCLVHEDGDLLVPSQQHETVDEILKQLTVDWAVV